MDYAKVERSTVGHMLYPSNREYIHMLLWFGSGGQGFLDGSVVVYLDFRMFNYNEYTSIYS